MPIPTTDEMVLPVLRHIADGQEYRRLSIIEMLTEHFSLTKDERKRLSDGVTMERPLERRGLIERIRVGYYRITSRGLECLNQNSEEIPTPDRNTETEADPPASNSVENPETGNGGQRPQRFIEEITSKSERN